MTRRTPAFLRSHHRNSVRLRDLWILGTELVRRRAMWNRSRAAGRSASTAGPDAFNLGSPAWPIRRRHRTHVLDYFYRPTAVAAAHNPAAAAVRPGGVLLVTSRIQDAAVEQAWWSRRLARAANGIQAAVAAHSELLLDDQRRTSEHLVALFRRPKTKP